MPLRVGNVIRKMIKNLGDHLYIGSNSSPVYNTFHITQTAKPRTQLVVTVQENMKVTPKICFLEKLNVN